MGVGVGADRGGGNGAGKGGGRAGMGFGGCCGREGGGERKYLRGQGLKD